MKKQILAVVGMALAILTVGVAAHAEETAVEKAQGGVDDVKKDTKRAVRKAKKKHRDASGEGSVLKDAQDGLNNAGDQINADSKKLKRKAD